MSFGDKVEAKKDQLVGEAKEKFGDATDDEQTQAEGLGQRVKGHVEEGVEDLKDAVGDAADKIKDVFN